MSTSGATYNPVLQIWIQTETQRPWIECVGDFSRSPYGETAMTETHEGVDQSEGVGSPLGETAFTRTHEGVDQSEAIQSGLDDNCCPGNGLIGGI